MKNAVRLNSSEILGMNPLTLVEVLKEEVDLCLPAELETESGKLEAVQTMNKAAAYVCYFKEMETIAKITKRERKRNGCSMEEAERLLGIEEVMDAYKRIAEMHYDAVTRMMYTKKLMLDEARVIGRTV